MTEAYPLQWPAGWERTKHPRYGRFKTNFANARDSLMAELRLMGARYPVLSTNIPLRRDGLPYARQAQPDDKGVAVYFEWKGRSMVFACDQWTRVEDNVQAVRKTIEALRGIERWGASDMMERAFTGFTALPPPGKQKWWEVLQVPRDADDYSITAAYRRLAMERHPDHGGSDALMAELNEAYKQAGRAQA